MGSRETSSSNSGQILSSSSAMIIAGNDDILTLILVCLPPKSLLKFKTVSKHWLSLISGPRFTPKLYSRTILGLFARRRRRGARLKNPEYGFINLSPNPSPPPFQSLTFVDHPLGVWFLQCCNGLMLYSSVDGHGYPDKETYCIYNPTTNQHRVLPGVQGSDDPSCDLRILDVNLAFDPSKSSHYKVEVYSSKTGTWKLSGSPFAKPLNVALCDGVFWNGAIHWGRNPGCRGDSICFDVEEEKFRDYPMPTFSGHIFHASHLEESGGHLYLMECTDWDTLLYDVYQMERNYSGWFLKYKVDFHPIAAAFPEMYSDIAGDILPPYSYTIYGIIVQEEETDDDSFLVLHITNKAIRYNFKDGSFTILSDFGPRGGEYFGGAYKFIESFASV
ncbi:hypothetical protein COLO4_37367 [Corchorus olitorius]|uniref:F-box domain-containing protein n=1 Tax=Corchorus olitorius TaxID=93759 RepID=A0A1R3G268_9ROSI|nr:hypothetical protein COLO4_37367 [Corchorus olitorius]